MIDFIKRKSASIYLRYDTIYIVAFHDTVATFSIIGDTVYESKTENCTKTGSNLLSALGDSRTGVPTPKTTDPRSDALLRATGVRSWKALAKNTKNVDVVMDDGQIELRPYRNAGPREGFVPIAGKARLAPGTPHELGLAVLEALEDSE